MCSVWLDSGRLSDWKGGLEHIDLECSAQVLVFYQMQWQIIEVPVASKWYVSQRLFWHQGARRIRTLFPTLSY